MSGFIKYITLFVWGGSVYCLIELLFRGHTHPSMFIAGGAAFLCIGALSNYQPWKLPLWLQMLLGSIIITSIELITGLIVNVWLGLGVWDYSHLPLNFLGQISLPFTIAWFFLTLAAIFLDDFLRWKLFDEERPRYRTI